MVHLAALPGSPEYAGQPDAPLRRALDDAAALTSAGFHGLIVENFGDRPFFGRRVPPVTVAAMTRIVAAVRDRWPEVAVGVNCLRNDASAALSIAAACGAAAIRVNVHIGAMVTDQGVLTGRSAHTLRLRSALGAEVRILADVRVKHAVPVAERPVVEEALDLRERGLADALLLTGPATGQRADASDVPALREALPATPLLVASGVTVETAPQWARLVDGAVVGSAVMHGGRAGAGVDAARARALITAWKKAN
jgi:membrane complex biogenesis BtpA family protein